MYRKSQSSPITLADLLTPDKAEELKAYLAANPRGIGRTTHNLIMAWIDKQPEVRENFRKHGIIRPYGAYLIEHFMSL